MSSWGRGWGSGTGSREWELAGQAGPYPKRPIRKYVVTHRYSVQYELHLFYPLQVEKHLETTQNKEGGEEFLRFLRKQQAQQSQKSLLPFIMNKLKVILAC